MSWLYKNKISFIVYLIILALSVSFCHSLGYDRGYADGEKSNPNLFEFEGNIFKTVAHIDMSDYENIELLYSDIENDIAYYVCYDNPCWVVPGDTVYFYEGTASSVIATDIYGFIVENANEVTFGFSGSAVLSEDGTQIGYVSERLENGNIYCIWI